MTLEVGRKLMLKVGHWYSDCGLYEISQGEELSITSGDPSYYYCSSPCNDGVYKVERKKAGDFFILEAIKLEEYKLVPDLDVTEEAPAALTGGSSVSYYRKSLTLPLTSDRTQYVTVDLEVGDFTDAWDLDGNQFNVVKAIARSGCKKDTSIEYDLDKNLWFCLRSKLKAGLITHQEFWQMAKACGLSEEV